MSDQAEPELTHESFNPSDADVTFKSSDNVFFKLHRKNLEITAGVFPGPEFDANNEVTSLQEKGDVLEILFEFAYPEKRRKIKNLEFELLARLAEAAEKYQMYTAMDMCEARFEQLLPNHAAPILAHAIKHGYPQLIDPSALSLCMAPISDVLEAGLPDDIAWQWSLYHEKCCNLLFQETERILAIILENGLPGITQRPSHYACALTTAYWISQLKKVTTLNGIMGKLERAVAEHKDLCQKVCTGKDDTCYIMERTIRLITTGMDEVRKVSFVSHINSNKRRSTP